MKKVWLASLIFLVTFLLYLAIDKPGYYAIERKVERQAKVTFVGDIFLDRYIRQQADKKSQDYLFECIDPFLKGADLVVGNLEGPITGRSSRSINTEPGSADNFIFTFPTSSAQVLYRHNIKVVNLGNNHISNFGREGIEETKKYLETAGVDYFGGMRGDSNIFRTDLNGINLIFISYNQFGGDSASRIVQEIKKERSLQPESKIILYAHWGEEYVEPTAAMRELARQFAWAGADAVIGSHPHVVQAHEQIGSTTVYYSLGNFIFDQYWNEKVSTGLAVKLNISSKGLTATEYPLTLLRSGQTCPSTNGK